MKSITEIRRDFPILERKIGSNPLVYFDNGATSQKPQQVIDSIVHYYTTYNANIHRGVHTLSQEATEAYEVARQKLQKHIHAAKSYEVLFTSGTTEGINLVATCLTPFVKAGDEILVLTTEHHSNIVPWQLLAERTGAVVRPIPVDQEGMILMEDFKAMLSERTKVVSCQHVSNALGNIHPVKEIIALAHSVGAVTLIDGAQSCPHFAIDVQDLDADFYVASGHKMYAPTGIGFLYGKEEWLQRLPPYKGGGDMIKTVCFEGTTYADLPYKLEAGTPNICGGIAYGVAIDYMHSLGMADITAHEHALLKYAHEQIQALGGITIYGTHDLDRKAGVLSFNVDGAHPYDVGTLLDQMGIAVRTGHHCAQPVMEFYHIPGTIRASFAVYNTLEEIDRLISGLKKAMKMLL
ncbi:cysteine desulfurase, SufS subfamily [Capnocytophaga sp. oral taxon 863 str. F0517]|uniref:aminotransferase class V-fold PLP-dependent enzyme n=1 Tax=Capnocytophaga sp. oral taxon 863 TaxID=1227265 RepID=UPI00039726AC|nr:cysteine desulfurase [Capnocytophaga sp. oral taxon 863]ERI61490.1 cysteine desulfurase, SufS subfamily [Capnocytophaga sp. oral taxon 863 str. F0517]